MMMMMKVVHHIIDHFSLPVLRPPTSFDIDLYVSTKRVLAFFFFSFFSFFFLINQVYVWLVYIPRNQVNPVWHFCQVLSIYYYK